jgi:hypothetical protein
MHSSENRWKSPQFCKSCRQTGPEKVSFLAPQPSFAAFFSGGLTRSPVSTTPHHFLRTTVSAVQKFFSRAAKLGKKTLREDAKLLDRSGV